MSRSLFRNALDREVATTLVEIIYTNPFKPERDLLNASVRSLTSSYAEGMKLERVEDPLTDNEEIQLHVHVSKSILDYAKSRLLEERGRVVPQEYATYEHLCYYYLFHRHLDSIDDYIRSCLDHPHDNPKWSGFRKLERDYRCYLELGIDGLPKPVNSIDEFASFCFQIRRAFFHTFLSIRGQSRVIQNLRARVWDSVFTHDMRRYLRGLYKRMADIYTLITGPSGSGKEVVARCIGLSRFIPFDPGSAQFERNFTESFHGINLSALSPTLIESELFGHRKGAFTGALQDRQGYFESAGAYGTVFLDEIGDTATDIQVKLLRVLQTRQFQPLGDSRTLEFQGKVMAATHVDLVSAIQKGDFREDFYFRLCADVIETPTLKAVLDEDAQEMRHLLEYLCRKFAGVEEGDSFVVECMDWISRHLPRHYSWPGNFRELEQCVRNMMVQGAYYPKILSLSSGQDRQLEAMKQGRLTLDELMGWYVTQEYHRTPSFAEVAHRLQVDPRTVKKHLQT
jgi:DNA-binding NtrC family response regulator